MIYCFIFIGIAFDDKLTKPKLFLLVKASKTEKKFRVEEVAGRHGVEVLRLPPYHPDLNPIEMVWGFMKVSLGLSLQIIKYKTNCNEMPETQAQLHDSK